MIALPRVADAMRVTICDYAQQEDSRCDMLSARRKSARRGASECRPVPTQRDEFFTLPPDAERRVLPPAALSDAVHPEVLLYHELAFRDSAAFR